MENEIRCEEWTGQKDYYGYVYATLDQKYNLLYIGQKKGLVEKTKGYYGSGSIIKNKIKGRGTYFLKKIILGVCFSEEELTICETECKYFFNVFDRKYGYNIIEKDNGGDTISNHPDREEICKKISESSIGKKHTEETKNKISIIVREMYEDGFVHPMKGKKLTEETKKKMSDSSLGSIPWNIGLTKETDDRVKKISDNTKGRIPWNKNTKGLQIPWNIGLTKETNKSILSMSIKNTGKKHTKESKQKISDSLKGHIPWNKDKELIKLDNEKIVSLREEGHLICEIAEIFNVSDNAIMTRLKKYQKEDYYNKKKEKDRKLQEVKDLYLNGYTSKEISQKVNTSKKMVYKKLTMYLNFPANFRSKKGKEEIKEFIKHYKETNNLE